MRVYIFLRQTEDWANISPKECTPLPSSKSKWKTHLNALKMWDNEFEIIWTKFRHVLHERSLESWGHLPILRTPEEVLECSDVDAIIPIDDDDWLHPEIESFIHKEMDDFDILQWTQILNSYKGQRTISKWGLLEWTRKLVYCTSDHCLRVKHLRTLNKEQLNSALMDHTSVSRSFFETRRKYVPRTMSCYNIHIGSHSCLKVVKDIKDIINNNESIKNIPNWAMWAKDDIIWLDCLIKEVTGDNKLKFF